jgi:hypothetical protein
VGVDASEPPLRRVHGESQDREAGGCGARGSAWSVPDETEISGMTIGPAVSFSFSCEALGQVYRRFQPQGPRLFFPKENKVDT